MDGMEWINKIVHGLTSIKELTKSNKHLSWSLKKEISKNNKLEEEVRYQNRLIKEIEKLRSQNNIFLRKIENLEDYIKTHVCKKTTTIDLPTPLQQMFTDETISI